jgi:hypothetical protein
VVGQSREWAAESLQFCGKQNDQCNKREVSAWRPPSGDILKLNIDGSFHAANKSGGWGFVIHDRDGDVRGSGAGHLSSVASAAQAEAHACAIQAAVAWGMTQVQIEADSQNLIRALQSKDYDLAPDGVIYRDVRLSLSLNFDKVLFSFVSRDCNKIAHCLAAYGTDRQEASLSHCLMM